MGDMIVKPEMMQEWQRQQREQERNQIVDDECYRKAKERGQKTFTLVEQDPTAVETIAFWIMKNIHTAPADKLRKALQDCIDMRDYKDTHLMHPAD